MVWTVMKTDQNSKPIRNAVLLQYFVPFSLLELEKYGYEIGVGL